MVLDINDKTLTMNVISPLGHVRDYFTIEHSETTTENNNLVPQTNDNGPYSEGVGSEVSFSSQGSTDTDGLIASYLWDFGDNSATSSLANPNYSYSQEGSYNAMLTVTDDKGAANSAIATVSITGVEANNQLINGVEQSVSSVKGGEKNFVFTVPENASLLSISLSGGTGDVDMYVSYDSEVSKTNYDCRPYKGGNEETCLVEPAKSGNYHVMLLGYNDYSDVQLIASFTEAENLRPTVKVNGPYQGITGSAISFSSAGTSDTDGSITSYD